MVGQFVSVAFVFAVLFFSASLLAPVEMKLCFQHTSGGQQLSLEMRSLGGLLYRKVVISTPDFHTVGHIALLRGQLQVFERPNGMPRPATDFAIAETLAEVKTFAARFVATWRHHRGLLRIVLQHAHITELRWITQLGLADAALTGMAVGGLWTIKSSLLSLAAHYAHVDKAVQIRVMPSFNKLLFASRLDCIVRLHLGDAMVVGILLGKNVLWGWVHARTTSD